MVEDRHNFFQGGNSKHDDDPTNTYDMALKESKCRCPYLNIYALFT